MIEFNSLGIVVDGVAYTTPRLREIIHERHRLVEENRALRDVARRQQVHLQRRTAALVRLIGRKPQ